MIECSNVFFFSQSRKSLLSIGPLDYWTIGPLVHSSIGPMDHWTMKPLDHWSIGPLFECQISKVNKVNLLSDRTSGVPLVIFLGKNLLFTIYQLIILDCVFKNNFLLYKRPCKSRSIEIHFNFQRNTFLCPEKYIFIFREIQFYLQRNTFLFQNCEVCQVL